MIGRFVVMMPVARWLFVLAVALPSAVAPWRIAVAREPEPSAPATAPTEPASTPTPAAVSTADAIHEANVRLFVTHFQQGKLQYHRGAYALAAVEFEQAFAAIAAEAALKNAALSHERAGDHVAAALAARRYFTLPACDVPGIDQSLCASHREELEALQQRVLGRIAEIELKVAPGVTLREIRINGRATAREDFPVLVLAGRVDIELQGGSAGQRRQRVIEVRAGETQTVVVDSFDAPIRVPEDRDPRPGTPGQRGKWLRPGFWVGVGLTSLSAVALATTGGLTVRAGRAYKREVDQFNENPEACVPVCYPSDKERQFKGLQKATNVMIGVTAGLAMVTLIVGAIAFTRPRNAGTTRASTRLRFEYSGSGVVVHY